MKRMVWVCLLVFGFILNWNMVFAADVYVESSGSCGGKTPCYSTIQAAIYAAHSGTTIKVGEGIYSETFVLDSDKQLIFQGGWDIAFTKQTPSTTSIRAPIVTMGAIAFQGLNIRDIVVPIGNATIDDVLEGKTFSNSSATGLTGRRPPAPVGRTGQMSYYRHGDDGHLRKGVPWPEPRFTAGTHVVADHLTGLMWQRAANNGPKVWNQAIDGCNGLKIYEPVGGGIFSIEYKDWRLPNIKELLSLIAFAFNAHPLSDSAGTGQCEEGDPFTGVSGLYYWSSTTQAKFTERAWRVYFSPGSVDFSAKSLDTYNYVWCVRGGNP